MTSTEAPRAKGRIVSVTGPVVDVEFPRGSVPDQFNALKVDIEFEQLRKTVTLEVASHLGDNLVRTISLQPQDGLVRGGPGYDTRAAGQNGRAAGGGRGERSVGG